MKRKITIALASLLIVCMAAGAGVFRYIKSNSESEKTAEKSEINDTKDKQVKAKDAEAEKDEVTDETPDVQTEAVGQNVDEQLETAGNNTYVNRRKSNTSVENHSTGSADSNNFTGGNSPANSTQNNNQGTTNNGNGSNGTANKGDNDAELPTPSNPTQPQQPSEPEQPSEPANHPGDTDNGEKWTGYY